MSRGALSPRTLAVLRWLVAHNAHKGYMPTVRETATAFRMKSTAGPRYHFRKLAEWRYIIPAKGRARTLRVTEAGAKAARA
jgi:SOS-response transcriptional repressor LexA